MDPKIPVRENELPPCRECPKIPQRIRRQFKGRKVRDPWRFAVDLSLKSQQAFLHWQQCEAVRWQVPKTVRNDPLVLRHARIISGVIREIQEARDSRTSALLQLTLTRLMVKPDG